MIFTRNVIHNGPLMKTRSCCLLGSYEPHGIMNVFCYAQRIKYIKDFLPCSIFGFGALENWHKLNFYIRKPVSTCFNGILK